MVDALCLSAFRGGCSDLHTHGFALPKISPRAGGGGSETGASGLDADEVYHLLYLPKDWQPGKRYPVIVEYAGNGPYQNRFGDISTGHPEGSKMGYGITGGRGYLGVHSISKYRRYPECYKVVNGRSAADLGLLQKVVPWICRTAGTPGAWCLWFFLGAIACNYLGLHDDESPSYGGHLSTATTMAYVVGLSGSIRFWP